MLERIGKEIVVGLVLIVSLMWPDVAEANEESDATVLVGDDLVLSKSGDLPIVLTAPHGGKSKLPGVPPRRGVGVKQFKTLSDAATDRLAQSFADELEKRTGKRPYLVIAKFHRKYVDANRSPERAYEAPEAKPAYDAFHASIAHARKEILARFGCGILLDLHGQASAPKTIIRGTQNGKTVSHLIDQFGRSSLIGSASLFGRLEEQGFSIEPPLNSSEREPPSYSGGYIVRTYGSGIDGALDAIQMEFGRELRGKAAMEKTAAKLAEATVIFAAEYLSMDELAAVP